MSLPGGPVDEGKRNSPCCARYVRRLVIYMGQRRLLDDVVSWIGLVLYARQEQASWFNEDRSRLLGLSLFPLLFLIIFIDW